MATAKRPPALKYEYFLLNNKALFLKVMDFLPTLQIFVEAGITSKEDIEVLIHLTVCNRIKPAFSRSDENLVHLNSTLNAALFHMICRKARERERDGKDCAELLISRLPVKCTRQTLARKLRVWM